MAPPSLVMLLAVWGASLGASEPAGAATPVAAVSTSPDVSVVLGSANQYATDENVIVDNLLGSVMLAPLGSLPSTVDVSAYELLSNADQLLCFDGAVELPGRLLVQPGDVVRFDGSDYAIEFDASVNGLAEGVRCDAVTVDATNRLLLSFDTTVALPRSVIASDEDLVRVDGPNTQPGLRRLGSGCA